MYIIIDCDIGFSYMSDHSGVYLKLPLDNKNIKLGTNSNVIIFREIILQITKYKFV